uniref:Uncharacterized protein n=1 Tax=Amphimedon queenslandica TaxID=400682 RepID=A0A1X7V5W6_AMPQE
KMAAAAQSLTKRKAIKGKPDMVCKNNVKHSRPQPRGLLAGKKQILNFMVLLGVVNKTL